MAMPAFRMPIVPFTRNEDGSIRVGSTRVLLDLVVHAFNEGQTPEEIVIQYPTLKLSEVYSTIAYYLENQVEIDTYVAQRAQEAEQLWERIESDPNQKRLRETLLRKRAQQNNGA